MVLVVILTVLTVQDTQVRTGVVQHNQQEVQQEQHQITEQQDQHYKAVRVDLVDLRMVLVAVAEATMVAVAPLYKHHGLGQVVAADPTTLILL